jgi:hypothetical protein
MYIYAGRHCQDGTDCPGELCLSPIGLPRNRPKTVPTSLLPLAGEGGPQGRKREETARFRGTNRDPVGSGGLFLVSQVAPVRLAAVMMGLWFAANAIANYLAGILESLLAGSSILLYWFLVGSSVPNSSAMIVEAGRFNWFVLRIELGPINSAKGWRNYPTPFIVVIVESQIL